MDEELPFAKAEPEAFDEDDGDLGDLEKDREVAAAAFFDSKKGMSFEWQRWEFWRGSPLEHVFFDASGGVFQHNS